MDGLDEASHPACVNDVASLTENGTSKTLASVFTNNVFPVSNARDTQLILLRINRASYAPDPVGPLRVKQSQQNQKPQVHRISRTYITKTLLFSNCGIRRPELKNSSAGCRIGRTRAELTPLSTMKSQI